MKDKIIEILQSKTEDNEMTQGDVVSYVPDWEFDEVADAILNLFNVSSSEECTAETIQALSNTLLANRQIGHYKHIESKCVAKLALLIDKIE